MDQGCPTLDHEVGMKIMMEVEQMMMRGDFAVRMLGGVEKSEEDEGMLNKLKEVKRSSQRSQMQSSIAFLGAPTTIPRNFHSTAR